MWDTDALYEPLLRDFEAHLRRARRIRSEGPTGSYELHVAISGFLEFCPPEKWGQTQFQFIKSRLEGDYALENLRWHEDSARAVQAFACLGMGAILGMYTAGQLDEREFTYGEMFLSQFLFDENEEIARRYALLFPSDSSQTTDG